MSKVKTLSILTVAMICHAGNKILCEQLGDFSQRPWDEASDDQQKSAIAGVEFALANPGTTPEGQHNAWLEHKKVNGWKWGPTKNEDLKEHPCFVPYDELPPEQQAKDHLFRGIVYGVAPFIEFGAAVEASPEAPTQELGEGVAIDTAVGEGMPEPAAESATAVGH